MVGQLQGQFLGTLIGSRQFSNFAVVENQYSPHENLHTHSHQRAFMSILLHGSYRESCGSTHWDCTAGQAILHEAGEAHANTFHEHGGRVLSIEFFPHYLSALEACDFQPIARQRIDIPHCWRLALQLERELSRSDLASQLAIEGLTMQILAELFRLYTRKPRARSSVWLRTVKDVVHSRYREPLTLTALAREADVHPVHLARTFSKHVGCSVGEYIRQLRITSACDDLANSDEPIAEIAARNGFADQSHLTRAVKQHTGTSPLKLRNSKMLSAFKC